MPKLTYRDEESGNESDNESDQNNENADDVDLDNNVTYAGVDKSHDMTENNNDLQDGFYTTQSGYIPVIVEHNHYMDQVSGHVLYNQAAVCTTWYDKCIIGSQSQ